MQTLNSGKMQKLLKDISPHTKQETLERAEQVEEYLASLGFQEGLLRTTTYEFTFFLSKWYYYPEGSKEIQEGSSRANRLIKRKIRKEGREKGLNGIDYLTRKIEDEIKEKYGFWIKVENAGSEIKYK